MPNVVSVAASSKYQFFPSDPIPDAAYFTNYGVNTVDIAAPGETIYSTYPSNSYQFLSGTSMATPFISGALSLLAEKEPSLTMSQLIQRLYNTSTINPHFENITTNGRVVNLPNLLSNTAIPTPTPSCPYTVEEIPFAPDSNTASYTNRTTGAGYYNSVIAENLGFNFQFYGNTFSTISISQSGFIEMGDQLSIANQFDNIYRNLIYPAVNTIAVLKSFNYVDNPLSEGIFTKKESNVFKIYWKAFDLYNTSAGKLESWANIYSNGVVEQFIKFPNERLRDSFNSHSLTGIRGINAVDAITYSHNGLPSPLKLNVGLRYIPNSGGCTTSGSATPTPTPTPVITPIPTPTPISIKREDTVSAITLNVKRKSSKVNITGNLVISGSGFEYSNINVDVTCTRKKKTYRFKTTTNSQGQFALSIKKSKIRKSNCLANATIDSKALVSSIAKYGG